MGTNISFLNKEDGRSCRTGYPTMSKRFEWLLTAGVIWLMAGVFLDGWAHNNVPELIETFFTPWHAVLYSGFTVSATVLLVGYLKNVKDGYHWRQGLPKPYLWSLAGVVIFGLAGNMDFLWHELFGFEEDVEALLSPSHLALAVGGVLIASSVCGPDGRRRPSGNLAAGEPFYRCFFPFSPSYPSQLFSPNSPMSSPTQTHLLVTGRWRNIFLGCDPYQCGAAAGGVGYGLYAGLATPLVGAVWDHNGRYLWQRVVDVGAELGPNTAVLPHLIAPLAAGLLADILLRQWQRSAPALVWWRVFSFLIPLTLFVTLFGLLITQYGIWWSIHMWLGASFLAGLVGLGLSLLLLPPTASINSLWYTQLTEVSNHD